MKQSELPHASIVHNDMVDEVLQCKIAIICLDVVDHFNDLHQFRLILVTPEHVTSTIASFTQCRLYTMYSVNNRPAQHILVMTL